MHLVYFHPDKKNGYGATREDRWPKRLQEQGLDISKGYIVEKGLTVKEASERERELQLRDGYPMDTNLYSFVTGYMNKLSTAPEAKRKQVQNTDHIAKGKSISKAKTGVPNYKRRGIKHSIETKRLIGEKNKGKEHPTKWVSVVAYKDSIPHHFKSISEAAQAINGTAVGIVHCLTGLQKTHRGYIFEYGH